MEVKEHEETALAVAEAPEASGEPATELAALAALLEQMKRDTARQCEYAKKQLWVTRLLAGACAVIAALSVCVCAMFVPRLSSVLTSADDVMGQVQAVATNLETVSNELAKADITGMLQNVDQLVTQSQQSMTQAVGDMQDALSIIKSFDIQSLNESILDLRAIVNPLARLLGR